MNPDFLPPLQAALRTLGAFAARHDVNDSTLAEIATELDRARALVASARGNARANHCLRPPGGPVDPTVRNGCLLCGTAQRRPARPVPEGIRPVEVLRFLEAHGQGAATERYGAQAVTRALALGDRHPSTQRPGFPAQPHGDGEI
ncbi:hypothetical protein [Streptomyces sp. NPDC056661]|uniref:hypothetical protein n=1 Tax=Streptomyces sp. NPDC056661 TaxID=3345898 RepID=UPI003692D4CB